MTSPFANLDAVSADALLTSFGEAVLYYPRASEQYVARTADPDRTRISVTGIFSAGPGETGIKGGATGAEFSGTTRLSTVSSEFWIPAEHAASIPDEARKGDIVQLIERPGQPGYSIVKVDRTDLGDIGFQLVIED